MEFSALARLDIVTLQCVRMVEKERLIARWVFEWDKEEGGFSCKSV